MATQLPVLHPGSLKAGADLRTKQYHAVKLDANGDVVSCAAVTDIPLGILQNNPNTGEEASVAIGGTSKWIAGGVCTIATVLATKADGRAQTAVATQFALGLQESATTAADGETVTVRVNPTLIPKA